jgi:release factor glutamine methyltransferase
MRELLRRLTSVFWVPATRWYLRKKRTYTGHEITVVVEAGVFHPGLFNSTNSLIDFLLEQDLSGKTFLELGCGTALIAIVAARAGALVTASDVSRKAVENARLNVAQNRATVEVIWSDLFDSLGAARFDWIIINPPYFARDPESDDDRAWYCGRQFEYFQKLFRDLRYHVHDGTNTAMILSSGTAFEEIVQLGVSAGYYLERIRTNHLLWEENFIFSIRVA